MEQESDFMREKNIARNMVWLTISGILAKSIDFGFRSYYSKRLMAEGMGIFSLIMSAFGLVLSFSSAGIGAAVSRIVAVSEEKGEKSAKCVVKTAVMIVLALGTVSITPIFFFSNRISEKVLGDIRCAEGLVCIVPAAVFMGISYCMKGYFYAKRKVMIPAFSEFVEQAVKLAAITLLMNKGLESEIAAGCAGVMAGMSLGELCSCVFLVFWFCREKESKPYQNGIGEILKMTVPMTVSAVGNSFFRMAEDVWIIQGFEMFGDKNAMGTYGLIRGMTMPLLVFPLNLISSFTAFLSSEISRAEERGNLCKIIREIGKIGLFFGFMVFAVFFVFSEEISVMVYGTSAVSEFIRPFSVLCPIMVIDTLSSGMLGGLGEQGRMLKYSLADTVLRLSMVYFLLPHFGIVIVVCMTFLSNFLTCCLTAVRIRKIAGCYISPQDILKPIICSSVLIFFGIRFIPRGADSFSLILLMGISVTLYTLLYITINRQRT